MARAESHERVPAEEEDLMQTIIQLRDMMKVMMERNIMLQGEGSNPSMHKEGGGDKTPGGNGGNGASPPPSPPPSSSSSSSSTSSKHLPNGHGKTIVLKTGLTGTGTGRFDQLDPRPVRTGTKTEPVGRFLTEPAGLVPNRPVRYQTGRFRQKPAGSVLIFCRTPANPKSQIFFCF
jgi:hypothetical protein